jgi:hypothetical protein
MSHCTPFLKETKLPLKTMIGNSDTGLHQTLLVKRSLNIFPTLNEELYYRFGHSEDHNIKLYALYYFLMLKTYICGLKGKF